jgi:CheY-like chemotaxis protein
MAPPEQEHGQGRASRTASSDPGPRHALIIEDDVIIAIEIEERLRDLGYVSFDVAVSPAEALSCATARRPDLITADVRIVGGTGIDAIHAIVAVLGEVPFFYVTGNIDMLREEGGVLVVEKPVQPRAFAAACARVTTSH